MHVQLSAFLKAASAREILVWAAEGDPHFAFPSHQDSLKNQIRALVAFNVSLASASTRLAGLQLDIEPWLLPQWLLCRELLLQGWLDAVRFAAQERSRSSKPGIDSYAFFQIDVVLPYWMQPEQTEFSSFFYAPGRKFCGKFCCSYSHELSDISCTIHENFSDVFTLGCRCSSTSAHCN